MTKILRALAAICTAGPCLFPLTASSQGTASQPEIVGLKLGMTIAQAKDVLEKYNSNIKVFTLYATDEQELMPSWGDRGRALSGDEIDSRKMHDSKIQIPIALIGGLVTHATDIKNNDVITENDKPFVRVVGEWFTLRFTPSDVGGRLYAIGRVVNYLTPGETPSELANKVIAKYGRPSSISNGNVILSWQYDVRGRQLPENNRDFTRCQSGSPPSNPSGGGMPASPSGRPQTLATYNDVSSGFALSIVRRYAPVFELVGPYYANGFRQCGVQLKTAADFNGTNITGFTVSLSDQNALGFDNGIERYLRTKITPSPTPAAPRL